MSAISATPLYANDIHPRVLVGPDELPAMRREFGRGIKARALSGLMARFDRYMGPDSPDRLNLKSSRAELLGIADEWGGLRAAQMLNHAAYIYLFTGDRKIARRGVELSLAMTDGAMSDRSWHTVLIDGALGIAYDALHDAMSDDERQTIAAVVRRGVELFRADRNRGVVWGIGTNMFLHLFDGYVTALCATHSPQHDAPLFEEVADWLRRAIHMGLDEGGGIGEGPSYGVTDANALSLAAEMLLRAGVMDAWCDEPRFANMIRHWAYLILPGGRGQETASDAWRYHSGRPCFSAMLHARRLNDPAMWWVWEGLRGRDPNGSLGPAPECFYMWAGESALYEDNDSKAVNPGAAGYPTAHNSGTYGMVTMRSGWHDDDVMFTLLAGGRMPGCFIHQHADAGHFSLFALNEAFSIDTGYGDIQSKYHSVMMPHGKEPGGVPMSWGNTFPGGRVEAFAAGRGADYVRINVRELWECQWAYRHAMLVKGAGGEFPGEARVPGYVVLVDDFNKSSLFGDYLWQMNSEPGNRIVIDEQAERVAVHGRRHRLEMAWSHPGAKVYSPQHRLELAQDQIDSFPIGHREIDVNYFTGENATPRSRGGGRWGAGLRPRVKATLWGVNGLLMTAMVPRREDQPPIRIERIQETACFGMVIHFESFTDTIIASPFVRTINLGGIVGEASLAVARRDASGRLLWWAAADAYRVAIDGREVLKRRGEAAALAEG